MRDGVIKTFAKQRAGFLLTSQSNFSFADAQTTRADVLFCCKDQLF